MCSIKLWCRDISAYAPFKRALIYCINIASLNQRGLVALAPALPTWVLSRLQPANDKLRIPELVSLDALLASCSARLEGHVGDDCNEAEFIGSTVPLILNRS